MEFEIGDQVEIIIGRETDLGFNVIINESFEGLLYKNEVFEPLERNSRRTDLESSWSFQIHPPR